MAEGPLRGRRGGPRLGPRQQDAASSQGGRGDVDKRGLGESGACNSLRDLTPSAPFLGMFHWRARPGTEGLGPAAGDSPAIPTLGDSLKKGRGQCPGESSKSVLRTFINEVINRRVPTSDANSSDPLSTSS